jgi:hypothetical protein
MLNFVLNLAFQLYLVTFGNPYKYYYQMLVAIVISIICMGTIPVVAGYIDGFPGFALSCILITMQGFANAIFQCNLFGICGFLPIKFVIGVSYGNGIAGIGANTIKFILLATVGAENLPQLRENNLIYYGVSILIMLFGLVLYLLLFKDPWFINELANNGAQEYSKEEVEEVRKANEFDETKEYLIVEVQEKENYFETFKILMKQLFKPNIYVFFNFLVTFSVFPGLLFALKIL